MPQRNEVLSCLQYCTKNERYSRQVFVTVWKGCTYTGEEGSYCHDAKQFFIFLRLPLFNSKALCDIFCIRVVEYIWGNALAEKLGSPLAMQHVFISEKSIVEISLWESTHAGWIIVTEGHYHTLK